MNQDVLTTPLVAKETPMNSQTSRSGTYLPAAAAIVGSILLAGVRFNVGGEQFISDGALMMLALASYLTAAVFYLTNFYAPFRLAEKLGFWLAGIGVFFNLSSWLVRWIAAYDRELDVFQQQGLSAADMPWMFRYVPFANLYDLSLAFAFGAGITTLLVMRRKQFGFVAVVSLPLAAIILVLARFIGSELIDLPPVLDSYWRPIHVGIASISYGVALVCFAVAVLYLLKYGVKVEKMAIWTGAFALA
ncbi:MAG: cytochrome c biogenesis protein CcsA, partial [Acidobacteriota bacterium]